MSAGAGALLEKPLDFTKLFQTINRLLLEPMETGEARSAGRTSAFEYHSSNTERLFRKGGA
jgi:hypothetical protein